METKKEIRKRILKKRSSLSNLEQNEKSRKIAEKILRLKEFIRAENILLYMDFCNEVQTGLLIETCLLQGKKIGIPKIQGEIMEFYELHDIEDVEVGFFGIREPVSQIICQPEQAFVIVPGVAFTRQGGRIGYGKGYYDRYLHQHPQYVTCGIAYDCQVMEQLPAEEHDVPLDMLITETLTHIMIRKEKGVMKHGIINTDR